MTESAAMIEALAATTVACPEYDKDVADAQKNPTLEVVDVGDCPQCNGTGSVPRYRGLTEPCLGTTQKSFTADGLAYFADVHDDTCCDGSARRPVTDPRVAMAVVLEVLRLPVFPYVDQHGNDAGWEVPVDSSVPEHVFALTPWDAVLLAAMAEAGIEVST